MVLCYTVRPHFFYTVEDWFKCVIWPILLLWIFLGCSSDDSFNDVSVCSGVAPNKEVMLLSFRPHSAWKVLFYSPRAINVWKVLLLTSSAAKTVRLAAFGSSRLRLTYTSFKTCIQRADSYMVTKALDWLMSGSHPIPTRMEDSLLIVAVSRTNCSAWA